MSPETIFFCGFLVGVPMGALVSMLAWNSGKRSIYGHFSSPAIRISRGVGKIFNKELK